MDEDEAANAIGRIAALELMQRNLLTAFVAQNYSDPVAGIDDMRKEMFSSLHNLKRPTDAYNDTVWEHAVEALDLQFESVKKRLSNAFPRS